MTVRYRGDFLFRGDQAEGKAQRLIARIGKRGRISQQQEIVIQGIHLAGLANPAPVRRRFRGTAPSYPALDW